MLHIRQYVPTDRAALYDVCLRTGADGGDATGKFAAPTILGEVYVGPYLEFHPDLALVVDNGGPAAGYVLCAPDTRVFEYRCESDWWPGLRTKYPMGSFPSDSLDAQTVGIIHAPHTGDPEMMATYPAHLHIDLIPEVQGLSLGGTLIHMLLDTLTNRGVAGVHLDVGSVNTRAIGFYEHLGFTVLARDDDTTTMGHRLTLD